MMNDTRYCPCGATFHPENWKDPDAQSLEDWLTDHAECRTEWRIALWNQGADIEMLEGE